MDPTRSRLEACPRFVEHGLIEGCGLCDPMKVPHVRKGYEVTMETNANAELAMRVKALEADLAALQWKIVGLTGAVEILIDDLKALRAQR